MSRMTFVLIIGLAIGTPLSQAAESSTSKASEKLEKAVEKSEKAIQQTVEQVSESMDNARLRRGRLNYYGLLTYSPLDLIIPSKLGASIGLFQSADRTWEFEYVRGTISVPFFIGDLGGMTDQRFSVLSRNFVGTNSFYISYGLSYMDFNANLGSSYLASVAPNAPQVDVVTLRSIGAQVSFGNQWIFGNQFVFGVDWIGLYQPLIRLKREAPFLDYSNNPALKDDVDDALKILQGIPRLTFLKVQVGYSF